MVEAQEEAQANPPRRKHKFGVTNRLLFPPHLYNKQLVQINQPFLSITRKPSVSDKVRKRCIPDSVLRHAISRALLRPMLSMERLCRRSRKGELTLRPWHWSLLEGYKSLSKVSTDGRRWLHKLEVRAGLAEEEEEEEEEEGQYEEVGDAFEQVEADDDEDFCIEPIAMEGEEKGEETDEEVDETDHQDAPSETTSTSQKSAELEHEKNKQDFAVKVLDTRVYRRQEDAWVTVLVVECKEPLNENGLWQAVAYAIREGLLNLQKGRVAAIHVMQWSSGSWSYGVVDIYGAVKIRDGVLTADSYEDFKRHYKVRSIYLGKKDEHAISSHFTKEALEKRLTERRMMMRKFCSQNTQIDYPNATYLVGTVFVDHTKLDLPNLTRGGSVDTNQFYEALLKIIVGKRTEKWNVEDVENAISEREKEMARLIEAAEAVASKRPRIA